MPVFERNGLMASIILDVLDYSGGLVVLSVTLMTECKACSHFTIGCNGLPGQSRFRVILDSFKGRTEYPDEFVKRQLLCPCTKYELLGRDENYDHLYA